MPLVKTNSKVGRFNSKKPISKVDALTLTKYIENEAFILNTNN
jgi:hypothetical protein